MAIGLPICFPIGLPPPPLIKNVKGVKKYKFKFKIDLYANKVYVGNNILTCEKYFN